MAKLRGRSKVFTTADGVDLNYVDTETGPPLVLLHGWSLCAEVFTHQIDALAGRYRVIALDQRGHGYSAKPAFGYRIDRLAKDICELLDHLDLRNVALLGHSLGSAVIWAYWNLFGDERLGKLILVDQPPCLVAHPHWSPAETAAAGPAFTPVSAFETSAALKGPDGEVATRSFIENMVTGSCPRAVVDWIITCSLRMPRNHAATLLLSNIFNDWRDTIPRLTAPTLVIGGEASVTPTSSVAWIAEQIPGARLEIFGSEEGGSHFMFVENPEHFNSLVADFMG